MVQWQKSQLWITTKTRSIVPWRAANMPVKCHGNSSTEVSKHSADRHRNTSNPEEEEGKLSASKVQAFHQLRAETHTNTAVKSYLDEPWNSSVSFRNIAVWHHYFLWQGTDLGTALGWAGCCVADGSERCVAIKSLIYAAFSHLLWPSNVAMLHVLHLLWTIFIFKQHPDLEVFTHSKCFHCFQSDNWASGGFHAVKVWYFKSESVKM